MRAALPLLLVVASCGWNVSRPFDRDAPPVKQAIADLDAGDAASAAGRLEEYLSTGPCKDGSIGTPDALRRHADGTFDLGLSLFRLGEQFGSRFGDKDGDRNVREQTRAQRHAQVECARRVLEAFSEDTHAPVELRARAHYLEGNLSFLDGAYEEAVRAYERALTLAPGEADGGDPTGRDAAWNRAIALERIDNEKDAGNDAAPGDAASDASGEGGSHAGDGGRSSPDGGGGGEEAGENERPDAAPQPPPDAPDAGRLPPPRSANEDERMLDQLETAPTLQQEAAKRLGKRRVHGMADK